MNQFFEIVLLTGFAGVCIPLGGLLGTLENLRPHWLQNELRHFMIALGGGILLGSIAEVLVPEGVKSLNGSMWSILIFMAGGYGFFLIERWLGLRRRQSPQLIGMMLDYIPEAVALGGLVALGSPTSGLLAALIALQNVPEGFNAYRELIPHNGNSPRKTLTTMAMLVPIGPMAGILGYYFLSDFPQLLGGIMLFASGGILYLIFQDIAPQSVIKKHWAPPLGAVCGFCIALFSNLLVEGQHAL